MVFVDADVFIVSGHGFVNLRVTGNGAGLSVKNVDELIAALRCAKKTTLEKMRWAKKYASRLNTKTIIDRGRKRTR